MPECALKGDQLTSSELQAPSHDSFQPIEGQLVSLKTNYEVQTLNETVDAFVIALPKRIASKAVSIVKSFGPPPRSNHPSFQHLRRFANTSSLPLHVQQEYNELVKAAVPEEDPIHFLFLPPLPENADDVVGAFRNHVDPDYPLYVRRLQIPLHPPISQEQAQSHTQNYWPCSYNPAAQTIQHSPSFNTLRVVTAELENGRWNAGHYLRLAQLAAEETHTTRLGRKSGAVAVDSTTGLVIAVAGDTRWLDNVEDGGPTPKNEGRPEYHALMRVIAMVAFKERKSRGFEEHQQPITGMEKVGQPLTTIEKQYFGVEANSTSPSLPGLPDDYPPSKHTMVQGDNSGNQPGYLCSNLDIYLTHEPCVMCSMGMVHSRFRACVFGHRMDGTGGLYAGLENGRIGYGLCWRKELNWRVMTFEYQVDQNIDIELFNA